MIRRPLCIAAWLLIVSSLAAHWLGISWIWRSPAGPKPEQWAIREKSVYGEGAVYRQEEKIFSNKTYTYLYLKQTSLFIESKKYPVRNVKCIVEQSVETLYGKHVEVSGKLVLPEAPGNPGEFDRRKYERARKIDFYLKEAEIRKITGKEGRIAAFTRKLRHFSGKILENIFPSQEAEILKAMLLGERSQVDQEVKEWYQSAGISHIIAISGLHMSLLGISIWKMVSFCGIPAGIGAALSVFLLTGYGILIENPTTAFRALLMFGIFMGAKMLGRSYDLFSALALAAILILVDNPDLLWDCGFQMSFMAVAGIGGYGNGQIKLLREMGKDFSGRRGKLLQNLLLGLFLWFFTLPVVLSSFYQVSVAGILCNLLVIPMMPFVVVSGGAVMFLGGVHMGWGSIAGIPAYGILKLYGLLGQAAEKSVWGIWTPGQPLTERIILYYLILGSSWFLLSWMRKKKKKILYAGGIYGITAGVLLFLMGGAGKTPTQIAVLDVGQGDGIVVQGEGEAFLIDGGSSSEKKVGSYVLLPYLKQQGIGKLTGIFLTHTDEDHVNGAREVLEEAKKGWFSVGYLFMPYWMGESEGGKELTKMAKETGTVVRFLCAGDQVRTEKMTFQVLFPGKEDYTENPNGGSLVLSWEGERMRGIFTGDLPAEQEKEVILEEGDYDFLKVRHHGSNGSSSEDFLAKVSPQIALISCGQNNRYGHPGKESMARIRREGAEIFRTDMLGAVTVRFGKNRSLRVEGFRREGIL